MKKKIRLALCLVFVALIAVFAVGCNNVQEVEGEYVVGDIAGFKLPHSAGLADKEYEYDYNSNLFYRNEPRVQGADPGALFASKADVIDSYAKFKDSYKYTETDGTRQWIEGWDDARFEAENGTEAEWLEKYGDMYYVAVTEHGRVSKAKYGADIGAYRMFSTKDFVNWKVCGAVGGYAIPVNTDEDWCYDYFWAPEYIRDPVSGMYFMFWGAKHKAGGEGHEYPGLYTGHDTANIRGHIAFSYNPLGPYELITTQEYYTLIAGKNAAGELLQSENTVTHELTGEKLYEVYGKDGETVVAYRKQNGILCNLNGWITTTDTPILNAGYYYTRLCTSESKKNEFRSIGRRLDIGDQENYVTEILDLNPVIDEKGDLYLYFTMSTVGGTEWNAEHANGVYGIWVVKMKDWITVDWDSMRFISKVNLQYVDNDGSTLLGEWGPNGGFDEGGVNEGCNVIYHEGRYYMTFSYFGYTDVRYSVGISVSDSPFGPFVKQYQYMPVLGKGFEANDYKGGTGHHCFVKSGDELFILYHCTNNPDDNYDRDGHYLGRHLSIDRIIWKEVEDLGYDMMFANGATIGLQPKPESFTGYENVAEYATIEGNGDYGKIEYLNDGMITAQPFSRIFEYGKEDGNLRIKMTWNQPVTIKALMIYNSGSYYTAFNKVNTIRFKLAQKPAWYSFNEYNDYCYIENLKVDERDCDYDNTVMRHGSAAIAEFNEITVTEIEFTISGDAADKYTEESEDMSYAVGYRKVCVSDIYIFGNKA